MRIIALRGHFFLVILIILHLIALILILLVTHTTHWSYLGPAGSTLDHKQCVNNLIQFTIISTKCHFITIRNNTRKVINVNYKKERPQDWPMSYTSCNCQPVGFSIPWNDDTKYETVYSFFCFFFILQQISTSKYP